MVILDSASCVRCGLCAQVCPAGLFLWEKKNSARFDEVHAAHCIHCGHCYAVCPSGSIELDGVSAAQMPAVEQASLDVMQRVMLFRARRSVRVFKQELVPLTVLTEALLDASYAPTASNTQKVVWTLVQDPAQVRALVEQTAQWLRTCNVPHYAPYIAAFDAGMDKILRGASQAIFAHTPSDWAWGAQDASAAVSYLELSLHTRGVGTCWTGIVKNAAAAGAVPALQLPADHTLHAGLMLGYPDIRYARLPVRKEVRLHII